MIKKKQFKKGTSLIEALIALAIFFILISGVMMLYGRTFDSSLRAAELNDVTQIAQESFSAVQSIAYNSWEDIVNGTHGLDKSLNYFIFNGSSDIINSRYTREITIESVERDEDCDIVESGGTVDPDTKLVTTNVSWTNSGRALSQSFSKYFTSFDNPTTCIVEDEGEAGHLVINIDNASIEATRKSIIGIIVTNEGAIDITIDKMTLSWTKPGDITFIKINGENVWHSSNGTGTPQGSQPSGTELDIVDFTLSAGESYDVDNIRFNEKIDGSTVTITATMSDGTSVTEVTTPPFMP